MKFNNEFLKRKVVIIGPYPPPIGGVSIHVKRYVKYLLQNNITDFIIFDDSNNGKVDIAKKSNYYLTGSKVSFIIKLFFKSKNKLIHYHSHNWIIRFLLVLTGKLHRTNIYFTFHSFRDDINRFGLLKRSIAKYVIKHGTHFIAVSENERNKLINYGCDNRKISIIPAFINPSVEENESIFIPKYIEEFIQNHEIIIAANASGIRFFNGNDLYGIDMCVELMHCLKQRYLEKVGIIFFLPQIENNEYFHMLNKNIKQFGIEKSFLFVTDKIQMFPIIKLSSIFIRPTNSDGDAISIRESIHYKVPSIASDIVERPEGTIVFKTRDQKDLEDKVINVINDYEYYKDKLNIVYSKDYAEKLFELYRLHLSCRGK